MILVKVDIEKEIVFFSALLGSAPEGFEWKDFPCS